MSDCNLRKFESKKTLPDALKKSALEALTGEHTRKTPVTEALIRDAPKNAVTEALIGARAYWWYLTVELLSKCIVRRNITLSQIEDFETSYLSFILAN